MDRRRFLGTAAAWSVGAAALGSAGAAWTRPAAAQPDPAKAAPMTEAQIQTVLRVRGYSDLDAITRDGDVFRIKGVSRYGERVGDIAVDVVSGEVRDERMTEAQARRMLRDRGYEEISEVRREGDAILARGRRGGSAVEVRIDPRSGAVTQTLAQQ
jgi:hypothetical protein